MLNLICVRILHKFHEETDKQITGCVLRGVKIPSPPHPTFTGGKGGELKHAGESVFSRQ
jgi:hypothetical protein